MPIEIGLTAEIEEVVTDRLTADALGNKGVKVYATPFVVSLMESASQAAILPHLPPGAGSVGTTVEMKHLAATPVGMKVRARAALVETDGKRCLFQVTVFDEVEKIAEGRHERFIVPNMEKFLARAMDKTKP
jgi:fluoroacetyl-CoA thioesterase